jgi:hypothetical protein
MLWHSTQKNKIMEQAIDTNLLGEEIVKKLKPFTILKFL